MDFNKVVRRKDLKKDGLIPPTERPYNCSDVKTVDWDKPRDSIQMDDCEDEFNLFIRMDNGFWVRVVNIDFDDHIPEKGTN